MMSLDITAIHANKSLYEVSLLSTCFLFLQGVCYGWVDHGRMMQYDITALHTRVHYGMSLFSTCLFIVYG